MTYPFDDDFMYFDYTKNQYVLTEKALTDSAVDIRARLGNRPGINAESVIKSLNDICSDTIYDYIHEFSFNTEMQDYLIAKLPSLRNIIYNAMKYQIVYISKYGDTADSLDEKERKYPISEHAKKWLERTAPEIGANILNMGI